MSCKCCSCIKHCPAWREVSLVLGKLETSFPSLEHLPGGEDLLEKLLFAGPRRQAVEMDLSSFLGQEDILHPWMILDFFEGWPI